MKLSLIVSLCASCCLACSDAEPPARPTALLTDQETQSIISAADIESLNGTYTGCASRTGSWSLAVTGSPTLDYGELSVIRGDVSCALAITEIRSGSDGLLAADTPIALSTTFGPARSFGAPIAFYATAAVGSVDFAGDFSISLLFSEQPRTLNEGLTATFATVTGSSASAVGVASPDYTLDMSGVIVTADIAGTIVSVLGNVVLTAGAAPGDFYAIVAGSVGDSYAAINTAYLAATRSMLSTNLAATAFLAPGVSLTNGVTRTLIIAKVTSGIASYQKYTITFSPPS